MWACIGSYFFFMELCFAVLAAAGAYLFLGQSIDLDYFYNFLCKRNIE